MSDLTDAKRALLAEWERKRDEYDTLINALRRELGVSVGDALKFPDAAAAVTAIANGIDVNQLVRPGDFFGMTQVDAIQAFLQRTNRQTATLQEIAAALFRGKATETLLEGERLRNLSSLLSKTDKIFFPVARGRWGLSEWYPGKQRSRKGKEAAQEGANKEEKQQAEAEATK